MATSGSGATGKPAISDIRNLDLRAVAGAVSNIRQRIEALEGALGVTTSTAQTAAGAANTQLNTILNELSAIDARVTILENIGTTDVAIYTAGETIQVGQGVVGISPSTIGAADPSDPTRMFGLIGLAISSGNAGASIQVQRRGVFLIPGASGFFVGRAAYLDNSGFVTQSPDYEATALPIGVAVSASQIFINPDYPAILQQTYSSGFQDSFERYLPLTLMALPTLEQEIDALPFSSGVDSHSSVPVTIGGMAVRVNAGDIAALGGGSQTLEQLIDGVSYSSGIPALGQVPYTIGGVALRGNAGDFWRFIFDSPYSSGVDAHALVPVEIGGSVVLVNAGDIAALGGGGGGGSGTKTIGSGFTPMTSQPPASNYATLDTRNSIALLDYNDSTEDSAFWVGVIPQGMSLSSGISVSIHWTAETATSGNVVWGAAFQQMLTNLDSNSYDTETTATGTTSGTNGVPTITTFTCTTIDSLVAGNAFCVKIARKAADGGDTMTGDAEIHLVELQAV